MILSNEEGEDLIHEFLLDRAGAALKSFDPQRGSIEGWLFVVFRRFVLGRYREQERARRVVSNASVLQSDVALGDPGTRLDLQKTRTALGRLPTQQRRALQVFFGESGGSIRSVARTLSLSRWRAQRLVSEAMERVAAELGIDLTEGGHEVGQLSGSLAQVLSGHSVEEGPS